MPTFEIKMPASIWMLLSLAAGAACSGVDAQEDPRSVAARSVLPGQPGSTIGQPAAAERPPTSNEPLSSCDQPFDARDIAFLNAFFPLSDGCPSRRQEPVPSTTSVKLTRDDSGKLCMSGQVTDGWATLIVGFDGSNSHDPNASEILEPLDAVAHGITQLRFTLDRPPPEGLLLETAFVVGEGCFPFCEIHGEYYIMDEAATGVVHPFNEPGTYTVGWSDFKAAPWADPSLSLDTTHLGGIFFDVVGGDFDFCLSNFALLDANGNPVP